MKLKCPKCGTEAEYSGYPPDPKVSSVACEACGYVGEGGSFKRIFEEGDKVKVRFGGSQPQKYKHGTFDYYKENFRGKYGFFIHTNSGKRLRRRAEEFMPDDM